MKLSSYFFVAILLFPGVAFATLETRECSSSGYTIATINGVFTDEQGAVDNMVALSKKVGFDFNGQPIDYQYLLNPSHLGGIGDLAIAVVQKTFENEAVQDYDLVEMIKDASAKVQTQKLLLVAHSQGNFYANSFYDTVADKEGGVPVQSIGVFSVANPASRVAGKGGWITSDTDHVIAGLVAHLAPFHTIKTPNTHIAEVAGGLDPGSGHDFTKVYLKYRASEIVKGIQKSLDKLSSDPERREDIACIESPKLTFLHKTEGAVLAVLDTAAETTKSAFASSYHTYASIAVWGYDSSLALGNVITNGALSIGSFTHDAVTGLISGGPESGNINMASVIGATQPSQLTTDVSVNNTASVPLNTTTDDGLSPVSPGQITESASANSSEDTSVIREETPVITVSTPEPTRVASYSSNGGSGGGGGGGGSPQPATQEQQASTDTENTIPPAEEDAPVADTPESLLAPTLSIPQCDASISLPEDNCLLATTTVQFKWDEVVGAEYYEINKNGIFATTTATSTEVLAVDYSDYTFDVSAVGVSGNTSATSTKSISLATTPLSINEIAWMGTVSSASDEWIELKNNTAYTLNLSRWVLHAQDGAPYIQLTGAIAPRSTRVLERRDDTVTSISAGQIYGNGGSQWALGNTGEKLILSYASTTIDQTPDIAGDTWSAGHNSGTIRRTMERVSSKASGSNILNWGTNDGIIKNGMDASGNAIDGTPGEENSVSIVHDTDNVAPVIIISGSNPATLVVGETYVDEGATATDEVDGARDVSTVSNVNALIVGTYEVKYSASDLSGNMASSTRVVNVTAVEAIEPTMMLYSWDLNENGIADENDTEVVVVSNRTLPAGEYHFHNLTITNNATLSMGGDTSNPSAPGFHGVKIVTDNLTITNGSKISADEKGYGYRTGPGASLELSYIGASYGGRGYGGAMAGQIYGSEREPIDLGSGGVDLDSYGGGAIHIISTGTITNNGVISVNAGFSSAGGSVYITANNLEGTGTISANSERTYGMSYSGPGGGGRVAVYYKHSTFTGVMEALGGFCIVEPYYHSYGENGTVVMEQIVEAVEEPVVPDPIITPPLSSEKMITSFKIILDDSANVGVIDNDTHAISITLPVGTQVAALAPVIEGSLYAIVSPASGVTQDFTTPVTYIVTAEDGTTQEYVVTVNVLVAGPAVEVPLGVIYPPGFPPFQEDVRTYSGLVTEVNGNSLTVHINQTYPFENQALPDRTVMFAADTKITKNTPGDITAFVTEMEVFMKKMQSGNPAGAVPPAPPQPIIETIAVSTIVVGDTVTVTALENVRTMKSFSASEIEVSV